MAVEDFSRTNNPIDKLATRFKDRATIGFVGAVNDALAKVGMGASSRKGLLGNLADAALASLASELFGGSKSKERGNPGDLDAAMKKAQVDTDDTTKDNPSNIGKKSNDPKVLTFPSNLGEYKMSIEIKQYVRPNPTKSAVFTPKATIFLPLPRTLEDKHQINYDSNAQGLVGLIADRATGATPYNSLSGALTGGLLAEAVAFTAVNLAKQTNYGEQAISAIEQMVGAIINPNLATMFRGPSMREHQFNWLFAPENEQEAIELQEIIRMLKMASLPNFAKDNNTAFLQYPNMVHIKLLPFAEKDAGNRGGKGWENNHLYIFKHAMINNISVNYAPDSPVFIKTDNSDTKATPAFISLNLSLIEIEYFTADDYGDVSTIRDIVNVDAKRFFDAVTDEAKKLEETSANATTDPNTQNAADGVPLDVADDTELEVIKGTINGQEFNPPITFFGAQVGDFVSADRMQINTYVARDPDGNLVYFKEKYQKGTEAITGSMEFNKKTTQISKNEYDAFIAGGEKGSVPGIPEGAAVVKYIPQEYKKELKPDAAGEGETHRPPIRLKEIISPEQS